MKLHLEHVLKRGSICLSLSRLGKAEGLMHFCQKALIGQASALDEWAYLSLTIIASLGKGST